MEQKKYGLTNPQKNIYLLENFYKGAPLNNVCGSCFFHSVLNFELLKKALYLLVQNNDCFKLHFELKHGEVSQYIIPTNSFELEIIEIPDVSYVENIELEIQKKVYNIFSDENTFDIKIFKLPNNHGGYTIQMHHLFSDSWTLGLVAHKVAEYYNQLLNEQYDLESNSENNYSYINYINDESIYLTSEKFKKDEEYWNSTFSTLPDVATITSKFNNSSNPTDCRANRSKFTISKEKIDTISEFCKENNISIFNFFMAVYSIYLSKVSNSSDFTIGTPILNRGNFAQKQTLGLFISTLPLQRSSALPSSLRSYSSWAAADSQPRVRSLQR